MSKTPMKPAPAASSTDKVLAGCLALILLLILWKLPATHDLMGFFLLMGFLTVGLTATFFVVRWFWRTGWFRQNRRGGWGEGGGGGGGGDGGGGGFDGGGGGGFDAGGGGSDW